MLNLSSRLVKKQRILRNIKKQLTKFWTLNKTGNPVVRIGDKEYERMCEELEEHFGKKKDIPEWLKERDVTEIMGHQLERTGAPRGLFIVDDRAADSPE